MNTLLTFAVIFSLALHLRKCWIQSYYYLSFRRDGLWWVHCYGYGSSVAKRLARWPFIKDA